MKKSFILFAGFAITAFLAACGSDNNGDGGTIYNCPAGYVYQNGYCMQGGGIVGPGGTIGGAVGFYSESYNTRSLVVNNQYSNFLKYAQGVCDRNGTGGTNTSCSTWMRQPMDIVIQAPSSQTRELQATFRVGVPQSDPYFNYWYQNPFKIPAGAMLPTLQLKLDVSVTNNYQGFEARGYGDFMTQANRSLIQLQIANGKLEDQSFDYRLAYRGEIIATGRFIRCGNPLDCGLSRPVGY